MDIAVIGLGKIGAVLSGLLAASGHRVHGYDVDPEARQRLVDGCPTSTEPGLPELLAEVADRIEVTGSVGAAVGPSGLTFIIVPTPSREDGSFSNEYVSTALSEVGEALRSSTKRHVVVLSSTVMPGSHQGDLLPLLCAAAGDESGERVALCYSPFFIALGSVIRNMSQPDFVLLGADDEWASEEASEVLRSLTLEGTEVAITSTTEAEIVKLAINSYVTTKISFANQISEFCESVGASPFKVLGVVGSDRRIGDSYLRPGLGFGGPCFPRDNLALSVALTEASCNSWLQSAVVAVNNHQPSRVVDAVRSRLQPGAGHVAVLGLAYKPFTDVVEESQGVMIARQLIDLGYSVLVHDPALRQDQCVEIVPGSRAVAIEQCVTEADLVVIATPWPEYDRVGALVQNPQQIINPWRPATDA